MTDTERRHQLALAAINAGRLQEAHRHCLAILRVAPGHADAWFLCGVIAAHNQQLEKALQIFANAIALAPSRADYHAERGKTLITLRRHREALAAARQALSLQPTRTSCWNTLGAVFSHAGEHEWALHCFQAAVARLSDDSEQALSPTWRAELYFNLGASNKFCGNFAAATTAYETAIALQPTCFRAHAALAQLRQPGTGNHDLDRLEALRPQAHSAEDQLSLGHAIASQREGLGDYQGALQALHWGKAAWRERHPYRAETDRALFATVRELFDAALFREQRPGCPSPEPIFIVGMPRTGTTLAERILGAHRDVFAAGELPHFALATKRLANTTTPEVLDIATLRAGRDLDPAQLGQHYLDSTRPRTGHTLRFIDKLPLNFAYLGLIRQALPAARLICLRRDPVDSCLANYRQQFASNFPYYQYANDLLDCGRYYLEFDRLIRHWQAVLPGGLLELQYEELVLDTAGQARRLLEYCGLDWDPRCLDFARQGTAVATASAVQVRRGIYRDAIGRWRHFGEALQPLRELLREGGVL